MLIIQIDIWDVQSGSKAKCLINRCFNVGRYIATICGANVNLSILQCKNCWQQRHATMSCHSQGSKCVKCNSSHKSENHQQFEQYCKANKKINFPHIEIKKDNPCPHSFKCLNCHGDYQVDSNICLFWKHRFHCKQHVKKYAEICENKLNSICSVVNDAPQ